ncbi:MAG TPA: MdtA/MuxA family multidrug efflux RND transporter periplasmic adaptor subunit [Burkholderiaceae bacterium]|nr:MdtA/MuxA family multidrug efflux RND transporter periplasmic adaptor subunit [Burkholderiaceae bacterium]
MRDDSAKDVPQASPSHDAERAPTGRRGWRWIVLVLVIAVLAFAAWYGLRSGSGAPAAPTSEANKTGRFDPANSVTPVSAAAARIADLPVRLSALGTVVARNTVTVRTRVDGELVRVDFKEGDMVKAGQQLAQIDPRPFEVALAQAQAQMSRDRAQFESAKVDLERYRKLLATDSIASQQVDTQEATVRQFEATVAADQAAVDSARLQLSYTRITSPVAGRVGLRQVDPGNLVHAGDTNGIVVVTEIDPIGVTFPLPQDNLPAVLARLRAGGTLPVDAFDRDGRNLLASGQLVTTDNLVDPATGTIKLKAAFDNKNGSLFPNQFVNARLQIDTLKGAVVVPTSSIQRGAPGTFVFVVKDDSTVTVRPVKLGPADGETTAIADGLAAGERVVTDGTDKLREGSRVQVIDRSAPPSATPAPARGRPDGQAAGERNRKKRDAPQGTSQ